jgi:hypothetical protein
MTPFPFPAALLLLVGVVGTACNDLSVGSSAQQFRDFGAMPANAVSPPGQNERFDPAIPKFVQGGYFSPLAKPLPVLDRCAPIVDRESGVVPAGTAQVDSLADSQDHQSRPPK